MWTGNIDICVLSYKRKKYIIINSYTKVADCDPRPDEEKEGECAGCQYNVGGFCIWFGVGVGDDHSCLEWW